MTATLRRFLAALALALVTATAACNAPLATGPDRVDPADRPSNNGYVGPGAG